MHQDGIQAQEVPESRTLTPSLYKLQLVRGAGERPAKRVVRDLASLPSSELNIDAPAAVDVRCREDRLEQRLGAARVECLLRPTR